MSLDEKYVARQPIFDRRLDVVAYELLARQGPAAFYDVADPDRATASVMDNGLHVHGFGSLTGGKRAFINITRELLTQGAAHLLPKGAAVVELLETILPDEDVLRACRDLKAQGYVIALDDFVRGEHLEGLIPFADIIKVDFLQVQGAARRTLFEAYRREGVQLLAEKVETHDDLAQALDIGYALFQGFFFSKPELVRCTDLPKFKLNYLRFLQEIWRPEIDFGCVEAVMQQEVSLSVRLLRYLNSALFGPRDAIGSIRRALVQLGERPLRRWGSLVVLGGLGEDKPHELVVTTLVRARLCEMLGARAGGLTEEASFLAGLLSTMDALLDRPKEAALDELAIDPAIKSAILSDATPLGRIVRLVAEYERGDWTAVEELLRKLPGRPVAAELPRLHKQALGWAEGVFGIGAGQAA